MGINKLFKVLVVFPTLTTLLLFISLPTLSTSLLCERGKRFLHHELQKCVNCTQCEVQNLVVLRPCDVHQDTVCAPLSKLFDVLRPENKHRHQRHRHKHRDSKIVDANPDKFPKNENEVVTATLLSASAVASTEAPFNNVETLVRDWQALALSFAVFSCILFFLVVALYSWHQAKQWRRLKENFESDVEELSARLSLMAASSSEKGEVLEPTFGPIRDTNYLDNRCMYLEQLLHVRKDKKPGADSGNVYIEESNPSGKT